MKSHRQMSRLSGAKRRTGALSAVRTERTAARPLERPFTPEWPGLRTIGGLTLEMGRLEPQRATILLVNADHMALWRIEAQLSAEGYVVMAVPSFDAAKGVLSSVGADLVVADVRLEAYNGLHLAARSQVEAPNRPVIITHVSYDPVLETEARHLGAVFVVNPLGNPAFLQQVRAAVGGMAARNRRFADKSRRLRPPQ